MVFPVVKYGCDSWTVKKAKCRRIDAFVFFLFFVFFNFKIFNSYMCSQTWTPPPTSRIDAFELWCWRTLLRVLWTANRSNKSILEEISPEYSLERLMLKLKLQYFGHLMGKGLFIGKDSDAGKSWRQEEKGMTEDEMVGWHHWLNGHEFEQVPGVGEGQGSLVCCSSWGHKVSNMTERLNNHNKD